LSFFGSGLSRLGISSITLIVNFHFIHISHIPLISHISPIPLFPYSPIPLYPYSPIPINHGITSGLNFLLIVLLIPVNFHFMKSYDINVENQSAFFHVLNQMRSIGGNVFQLYKADIMESFPYIDNVRLKE